MAGELWLIDTNVILRWIQPEDRQFAVARSAIGKLEQIGSIPCYTSQNLGEFWNALTRPLSRNGYGATPQEAGRRAETIESRFRLLPDDLAVHFRWRRLLVDYEVSGVQVHDARLVAAMIVHGVGRILTFNARDFARFIGIDAIHPADLDRIQ
jgi:predicted nucleic acid-binding protein